MTESRDYEDIFRELQEARFADDEVHRVGASLEERIASRERLHRLRSEMATARAERGIDTTHISGLHDSRTRRGSGYT